MPQPDRGLVLLLCRDFTPTADGTGAAVRGIANQLLHQGFRVRVYTPALNPAAALPTGLTAVRVREHTVAGRELPVVSWWLTQRRLARLLDREAERPAAVHVFDLSFGTAAVNWARRNGVQSVVTLTTGDVPAGGISPRSFLLSRALRSAGLVTSPSRLLARMAGESRAAPAVHVVPHGIDFSASATAPHADTVRRRLGIPADAFVFLSIQQLVPGRTPVNAVRAFAHATRERRHAYLLVAGDGPGRGAVERIADETGTANRVVLAGAITSDEVAVHLRAADAFVVDAAFESHSTEAMAAMAAGLPVIGTRTGALPEIVEDGRTGLLSRFGDVDSMARDMRRVMTNPELRKHLGSEARRSAISFDWSSIAEQYTAGYGAA